MWNRFRLWLSRNEAKIITIALCIIGFLVLIKSANNIMRERFLENVSKESENTDSIFEGVEYSEEDLNGLDKLSDEYKSANTVTKKIIRAIYNAGPDEAVSAREDFIKMCSKKFIQNLTNPRREVTTDNIMTFVFKVKDESFYSISNIYKYGEKDGIVKYIVDLRYDDKNTSIINSYLVINIDKNNNTFSYDGNFTNLSYIYGEEASFEAIENNGVNSL